jgi:hypothetical protein
LSTRRTSAGSESRARCTAKDAALEFCAAAAGGDADGEGEVRGLGEPGGNVATGRDAGGIAAPFGERDGDGCGAGIADFAAGIADLGAKGIGGGVVAGSAESVALAEHRGDGLAEGGGLLGAEDVDAEEAVEVHEELALDGGGQAGAGGAPGDGERAREVEIVRGGGPELATQCFGLGLRLLRNAPVSHVRGRAEAKKADLGGAERGEGEVEAGAVVGGGTEVAKGEGVEAAGLNVCQQVLVAGGLGHLEAVDEEVLTVNPGLHVPVAEGGLGLGDLVLVVGEDVVDAAGVEVDDLAEVTGGDGGALDVPAGEAVTPGAGPLEVAAGLGGLPEGEVALVALEGVRLDAAGGLKGLGLLVGELTVFGEAVDGKVDVAAGLVGMVRGAEALDHGDHVGDGVRCAREDGGGEDVEGGLVAEEGVSVEGGDVLRGLARSAGGGDHLVLAAIEDVLAHVADVGDVLDVGNGVTGLRGHAGASRP